MLPLKIDAKLKRPVNFATFDKKTVKKGMRGIGRKVRTIARKLVSTRGVSQPGEYPGRQTGILRLSISERVSKSGFSVAIAHYNRGRAGAVFAKKGYYPAMVYYGHVGPKRTVRDRRGRRKHRKQPGVKVAALRRNYIEDACQIYGKNKFPNDIRDLLDSAIKPGPLDKFIRK